MANDFCWALQQMREGKRVIRPANRYFYFIKAGCFMYGYNRDDNNHYAQDYVHTEDLLAEDWIEHKE